MIGIFAICPNRGEMSINEKTQVQQAFTPNLRCICRKSAASTRFFCRSCVLSCLHR